MNPRAKDNYIDNIITMAAKGNVKGMTVAMKSAIEEKIYINWDEEVMRATDNSNYPRLAGILKATELMKIPLHNLDNMYVKEALNQVKVQGLDVKQNDTSHNELMAYLTKENFFNKNRFQRTDFLIKNSVKVSTLLGEYGSEFARAFLQRATSNQKDLMDTIKKDDHLGFHLADNPLKFLTEVTALPTQAKFLNENLPPELLKGSPEERIKILLSENNRPLREKMAEEFKKDPTFGTLFLKALVNNKQELLNFRSNTLGSFLPNAKPQVKPPVGKPEAAKPEAAKPAIAKPEAAKPAIAKPEAAKPATAKIDTKGYRELANDIVNDKLLSQEEKAKMLVELKNQLKKQVNEQQKNSPPPIVKEYKKEVKKVEEEIKRPPSPGRRI